MRVREIDDGDRELWLSMRRLLWPTEDLAQHSAEVVELLANRDSWGLFLAEVSGKSAGFAECRIRETAVGCTTSDVGYLEGWYVAEEFRRQGVGKALVECCEDWARARGATEMASDTTSEYPSSPPAHTALGFLEVERRFLYRKSL